MITLFLYLKNYLSIGNAFALSLGIVCFLLAFIPIVWQILCMRWSKIRIWTEYFLASLIAFFTDLDFLSEREDDPVMPREYASWASAKAWRESCVHPKDRRM